MAALVWDKTGERTYETGVDHGVLFVMKEDGSGYDAGVAWNGLTGVTESPSGAEASAQYADNIKYPTLTSFNDFDIDYNQYKYLIETRMSAALTKPKSAIVIRR